MGLPRTSCACGSDPVWLGLYLEKGLRFFFSISSSPTPRSLMVVPLVIKVSHYIARIEPPARQLLLEFTARQPFAKSCQTAIPGQVFFNPPDGRLPGPFAGGCEAVVLYTVRKLCGGGCQTAVSRQVSDRHLKPVRQPYVGSCETEVLFPVRQPFGGSRQMAVSRQVSDGQFQQKVCHGIYDPHSVQRIICSNHISYFPSALLQSSGSGRSGINHSSCVATDRQTYKLVLPPFADVALISAVILATFGIDFAFVKIDIFRFHISGSTGPTGK